MKSKKRQDTFFHHYNLRNTPEVKAISKSFGDTGVKFVYFLFEVLTNKVDHKIELIPTLPKTLAADFDIEEQTVVDLIYFCVKQKFLINHNKQFLTCPYFEKELITRKSKKVKKPEIISSEKPTHKLQIYIKENCPNVSQIKEQITEAQCKKIVEKFSKEVIKETLESMENRKDIQGDYNSVYLTLNKWCKKAMTSNQGSVSQKIDDKPISINSGDEKLKQWT